ncbi:MAG: Uncharacterised protein [Flavobacteriales bacterium]|nr:MAG: Uncharacterised protein [Flavobacteriales bacterium]|tara:strand:+ start:15534 stop:15671 length:138 start_codon:yes stop_codon:yes gene_type:complete
MDKLYTLPYKNTPSPNKDTLLFITQFAAAYNSIKVDKTPLDFIVN